MGSRSWLIPLAVVVVVLVISAGFAFGGPQIGLPLGALAAALMIVIAINQKPFEPIEPPPPPDSAAHVLVVVGRPLDDVAATETVTAAIEAAEAELPETNWPDQTEVLVLAPASTRFLDRWATDFSAAREAAQRRLVVSVASLARAEIGAEARVGDQDLVQATEDQLRDFPATRVILVTGPPGEDTRGDRAAADLERRLSVPLTRVTTP